MKKDKLSLNTLKVKSFVTSFDGKEGETVKGGILTITISPLMSRRCMTDHCPTRDCPSEERPGPTVYGVVCNRT